MVDAQASIPLTVVIPVASLALLAITTLFGLLMHSKAKETKGWMMAYTNVVLSRRRMRRDIEEATLGTASVPPPSEDEDRISRIEAMDLEDQNWKPRKLPLVVEDNLDREERAVLQRQRALRQYSSEGEVTPSADPPIRQRMKSRPR